MRKSKSILTAGGVVDPTVVFNSLQTLNVQQGDHLHFSWEPSCAMHDQLQRWRRMGVSLSWETDGRMNTLAAELMDVIFMNEDERQMYQHQGLITDAWIQGSKHDVSVVCTLGDAGAEAYFKGERFFCKASQIKVVDRTGGGDAFDAGFLDAWLNQCSLDACLTQGLRSAALVLGQPGPRYRNDT